MRRVVGPAFGLLLLVGSGCRSSLDWRREADERAGALLEAAQRQETGRVEPLSLESAEDTLRRRLLLDQGLPVRGPASLGVRDLPASSFWPAKGHLLPGAAYAGEFSSARRLELGLLDAIRVAAASNRDFQSQKETLFQTALALDLEEREFRSTFMGMLKGEAATSKSGEGRLTGAVVGPSAGVTRTFRNGVELASSLSLDLARMLSGGHGESFGLRYDGSVSVPLLRGSGKLVVTEPLTQAQRALVYAVRDFEQYKRDFVVRIANSYLGTLRSAQTLKNQEENYRRVVTSTRRSRRMADAGLLPEYQFDQTIQTELNARVSWISARQALQASLEAFRVLLGLPPDAEVYPRHEELDALVRSCLAMTEGMSVADYSGAVPDAEADVALQEPDMEHSGPNEISRERALELAFRSRPDLLNLQEKVEDAQRGVLIAEDGLRAELTLGGSAAIGESRGVYGGASPDASFRPNRGSYSGLLRLDLPFERTAERNRYRASLIALERSVRSYQALEDSVKQDVYGGLRDLLEHREGVMIQQQAVKLAERRVRSTDLLLQAGRAEQRDVLEAQSALLSAQNSLYSAVVAYRLDELSFQRTLGVLEVSESGVWKELDLREYK